MLTPILKNLSCILLLCLILLSNASAQERVSSGVKDENVRYKAENFDESILPSNYGGLLVYNGDKNSITLKFVSPSFKVVDRSNEVYMDGITIKAYLLPFHQKVDFANADKKTQKKILDEYRVHLKSLAESLLEKELQEQAKFLTIKKMLFLQWTINRPASDDKGLEVKQVHLMTVCFDQFLILNTTVPEAMKEKEVYNKLFGIASTIELHPNEVQDLKKLSAELKK